jgi:hypothetical protein
VPYPVKAQAAFPTVPTARYTLIGVRVLMAEYHNEMCILRMRNTVSNNSTFRAGTPVVASWGFHPLDYQKFVGYVLWAKPMDDKEKRQSTVEVVCMGASYSFKESNQRIYTEATSEAVIGSIAAANAFDFIYDNSDKVWGSVSSPGHNDWQFMVKTARRRGATFFMRNTTMFCYDPVAYLNTNLSAWPVVNFSSPLGGPVHVTKAVADISDDETSRRFRKHRMLTVDPVTLQTIDVTEDFTKRDYLAPVTKVPSFTHFSHTPATTTKTAANTVDSHGRDHRFNQTLKIKVPGSSRLLAGGGVIITGYDSESDGLWYIAEVEHDVDIELRPHVYWCELTLLRDSRAAQGAPPTPDRPTRGSGASAPRMNSPVLVNRKWISPRVEVYLLNYNKVAA